MLAPSAHRACEGLQEDCITVCVLVRSRMLRTRDDVVPSRCILRTRDDVVPRHCILRTRHDVVPRHCKLCPARSVSSSCAPSMRGVAGGLHYCLRSRMLRTRDDVVLRHCKLRTREVFRHPVPRACEGLQDLRKLWDYITVCELVRSRILRPRDDLVPSRCKLRPARSVSSSCAPSMRGVAGSNSYKNGKQSDKKRFPTSENTDVIVVRIANLQVCTTSTF